MNPEYTEGLREKLKNRVNRLYAVVDARAFHFALKQFWDFLQTHPVFVGVLEDLHRRYPTAEAQADRVMSQGEALHAENELEQTALSYSMFNKCAQSDNQHIEWRVGSV